MSRREVKVVLNGDSSGAEAAFGRGAVSLEAFHSAAQVGIARFTTLGGVVAGLATGALATMALGTVQSLDALNDFSDATGTSIEMASALEDVALRTGTSLETVESILVKLNGVLADAKPGSPTAEALRRIGLDAAELRNQDPAEALRSVAVALSQFADDGNKARLIQELFGKSVREAAPFLKDLAERSQLVGTVTAEATEQAERFNRQLAAFEANAAKAKRGLMGEVLPALNRVLERFNAARDSGVGFVESAAMGLFGGFQNQTAALQGLLRQYNDAQKDIASMEAKRASVGLSEREAQSLQATRQGAEALERYINAYKEALKLRDTAGGGRGSLGPDGNGGVRDFSAARPSVGAGAVAGAKPVAEKESEVQKYIDRLMQATISASELTEVEKLRFELMGRLSGATAREIELLKNYAEGVDALNAKTKLMGPSDEELLAGADAMRKQIESLVSDTDTARIAQVAKQIETLKGALDDPAYGALQPAIIEKLTELGEEARKLGGVLEGAGDELQEFALQAQRNIQSALADTLVDTFTGATDKILDRWVQMLIRLVAEAKAAELAKSLLGAGTTIGNWLNIGGGTGVDAGGAFSAPGLSKSGMSPSGGAAAGAGGLKVEVINNAGAEITPTMDEAGTLQIIVDRAVAAVDQRIASGGSTRKAIAGAFALRPALSRRG